MKQYAEINKNTAKEGVGLNNSLFGLPLVASEAAEWKL